jgi:hypothetical protein
MFFACRTDEVDTRKLVLDNDAARVELWSRKVRFHFQRVRVTHFSNHSGLSRTESKILERDDNRVYVR